MSDFVTGILALLIGVTIGVGIGGEVATANLHVQAVQHGYAEYYLDSHYDKQWRWK